MLASPNEHHPGDAVASSSIPSPSLSSGPLSVSEYRDLLLNLKAQNATDLSSSVPLSSPTSASSPSPFSALNTSLSSIDSSPSSAIPTGIPSAIPSRLPVHSAVASKSFAEKKARLAAQAQQYKTLPTKRLHATPITSVTPPVPQFASPAPNRPSPAPARGALASGPLSPTRARPSAGFAFPTSSSSSSPAIDPTSSTHSAQPTSTTPKSRTGMFGSHLPPISTENQRLTAPNPTISGGVVSIGSVMSPPAQQGSAPIASLTSRTRTGSAVSPRYQHDASQPLPSPTSMPPPSSSPPSATSLTLPSPRRSIRPTLNPAAAFSPSFQARLASNSHPLVSPRRRTVDVSPTPREDRGVESLQAEFERLSAQWQEQKVEMGSGAGSGVNASFSHGPTSRPSVAHHGAADDSALSHRRQRITQHHTMPSSPRRHPVERQQSGEEANHTAPFSPPVVTAGYVHSSAPHAVMSGVEDRGVDVVTREGEAGLLADPFADGGEGLLDDEELNLE